MTHAVKRRRAALLALLFGMTLLLSGCSAAAKTTDWNELQPVSELTPQYAQQFSISYYEQGYKLISVADGARYLVVPQGQTAPGSLPADVVILQQPLDKIYLVATSAMDLFRALDEIGSVRLSGTNEAGWYLPEAKQAMESGAMLYAGKYSAPDYELILSEGCNLALESTMIYHSPQVKEQFERLGIPVFVERSSYESDPLGRMEWIKLYGALLNRDTEAKQIFDKAVSEIAPILQQPQTGKTVLFFYITTTGTVNVRKSGDYVAKMIKMAGGEYLPRDLSDDENALSTMNMDMESFYAAAKDADVLIYNSTIDGELQTVDQLLQKSSLLADFKAVQTGNVYCTGRNMFQESMGIGQMIQDIHAILTEDKPQNLTYLYPLT